MRFSKMHSLGNSFVVIDAITQNISFSREVIYYLGNQNIGIGFDQLLIVEPPYDPNLNFHYRIFNANGREVMQCGNGACCFAHFVRLKGLTKKREIYVSTANRHIILNIINDNLVRVNMGEPNFEPSLVPFCTKTIEKIYVICSMKKIALCGIVSMGNPHCVIQVDDIQTASVATIGPLLENHECFPEKANISFMQIIKREYIRLRVYERDTGETKSCGSGACAAVAAGIVKGLLAEKVYVELPGGKLNISWKGPGHLLYMTGPATHIYDGFIQLRDNPKIFNKD